MKKLLTLLTALMLSVCCICACAETLQEDNWYFSAAIGMMPAFEEILRDDNYILLHILETYDCIYQLREADFSEAIHARWLTLNPGMISLLLNVSSDAEFSQAGETFLRNRIHRLLTSTYIGSQGVEALAAANVIIYSYGFIMPDGFENSLLLVEFDGAVISFTFEATSEETVLVTAQPLFGAATIEELFTQEVWSALPAFSTMEDLF